MPTKDRRGWVHEPCPYCLQRGAGIDHGRHLGRNGIFLHCLRCGFSGRTRGAPRDRVRVVDSPRPVPSQPTGGSRFFLPDAPPDRGIQYAKHLSELWHWHLSLEELDPFVAFYSPDAITFNVTALDGRRGYFERYFGRDRKCKQSGELGWCYPGEGPLKESVTLVEGIADAIACSSSTKSSVALMGTGNAKLAYRMLKHLDGRQITVLMDGDAAGRRAERTVGRALLRQRKEFLLGRVPDAQDPASLGRAGVNGLQLKRVRRIEDLLNG